MPLIHCPNCGHNLGDRTELPEECRALREAAQISLNQLAHEIGISKAWLSMVERGERRVHPGFVSDYRAAVERLSANERKAA